MDKGYLARITEVDVKKTYTHGTRAAGLTYTT